MTQVADSSLEDDVDGPGGVCAEFFDFSDRTRGRLRLDEVRTQISQGRFVWVDVDCDAADVGAIRSVLPDDVGRRIDLGGILALHFRTASEHMSALHRAERLLHIVLVGATHAEQKSGRERLDIVIGEGFLLTLRRGPHAVLSAVRRHYVHDFEQHAATPSFLLYEICNKLVEQFLVTEGRLEEEVEATRVALQRATGEAAIERLAEVSGRLLVLRKRVVPVRRVLEELVSRKTTLVSEATLGFLSLMIGTLDRLLTDIASNREILDNSLHLSLTVMSHRTNKTMNRLAVVSTIFLPLTFLCGVYGMNFEVMPEIHWAHGYIYFWVLSGVVTLTLVVLLRRSRLL